VYALNALTGTVLWQTKIEPTAGVITGAPTLANGTLYVGTSSAEEGSAVNPRYECCKFRGSVTALDAKTGAIRWKSYTIPEEPAPTTKFARCSAVGTIRRSGLVITDSRSSGQARLHNDRRRLL
jgi:polyvinyl alcohol dehydrogenase (cytochrome)